MIRATLGCRCSRPARWQPAATDGDTGREYYRAQNVWPEFLHALTHQMEKHMRDDENENGDLPVAVAGGAIVGDAALGDGQHHEYVSLEKLVRCEAFMRSLAAVRDGLTRINQDRSRIDETRPNRGKERGPKMRLGIVLLQRRHEAKDGNRAKSQQAHGFPK